MKQINTIQQPRFRCITYLSTLSRLCPVITQELCSANIMVLSEFDKRVLNAKIAS